MKLLTRQEQRLLKITWQSVSHKQWWLVFKGGLWTKLHKIQKQAVLLSHLLRASKTCEFYLVNYYISVLFQTGSIMMPCSLCLSILQLCIVIQLVSAMTNFWFVSIFLLLKVGLDDLRCLFQPNEITVLWFSPEREVEFVTEAFFALEVPFPFQGKVSKIYRQTCKYDVL